MDVVVNAAGSIVQSMAFDPFGRRRSPTNYAALADSAIWSFDTTRTTRGYTGHEQLDPVGLVHMNGRVYDPTLGRFLSPDPFVQDPSNTQSLNRYTYVFNNPSSYTDPSGHFSDRKFKQCAGAVLAIAVTVMCAESCSALAYAGWSALAGAAGNYIATGSLQGALKAAFASAIMAYGGSTLAAGGFAGGEMLGMAALGGISSMLQGGTFGHGFLSAGAGAVTAGKVAAIGNAFGRTLASSIVGGTVSAATGGRFANGAAMAVFAAAASGIRGQIELWMMERSVFNNAVAQAGPGVTIGGVTFHSASGAELTAEQIALVTELMQDIMSTPAAQAAAAYASSRGIRPHILITDELPSGWILDQKGSDRWATINPSMTNRFELRTADGQWFPNSHLRPLARELGHVWWNHQDEQFSYNRDIYSPSIEFENSVANQAVNGDRFLRDVTNYKGSGRLRE